MQIVFCSELIPVNDHDTSVTPALMGMIKNWNVPVTVIRPFNLFTKNPSSELKKYRLFHETVNRNIRIIHVPLIKIPGIRQYIGLPLALILRKIGQDPDVFVGHSMLGNCLAYKLGTTYDKPFTAGLHHSDIQYITNEKRFYSKLLQKARLISCRSNIIANRLRAITAENIHAKIYIAHSGIPLNSIEPIETFIQKALQLKNGKKLQIITVARLQKLKNIDITLTVLSKLTDIEWQFTIVGNGEEHQSITRLVGELNLGNKVKMTGWLNKEETARLLCDSNLFIMISAPETFGLAYLEAMAKGCIVIGAKGWGIDGIIINEQNGFLLEPRNEQALFNLLKNFNHEDLETINRNSYQTIVKFDEMDVTKKYLEAIERI